MAINDIINDSWQGHSHGEVEQALKDKIQELTERLDNLSPDDTIGYNQLSSEVKQLLTKAQNALQTTDIADWAKAANKPSYNANEIGGVEGYTNLLAKLQAMDNAIAAAGGGGDSGLLKGTYADAVTHAMTASFPFCWLWVETVNGENIKKPIWYDGVSAFVDAVGSPISIEIEGDDPDVPTFSQAGNVVTITPDSGSVLHYTINGGTEQTSSTAVQITIEGTMTIVAWCVNAYGSSTYVEQEYTAAQSDAPAAPTMSINGAPVSQNMSIARNTIVTITASEGDLYVKVGSGNYEKASGSSATVTCSGDTTVISAKAIDPETSLESNPVSFTFTVAKPAAPTLPTSGEVARGGSVTISVPTGGELHYRINGGSWMTSANLSESITIHDHLNQQDQMVIEAYNIVGGEQSDTVTGTYTMAALQAPKLTPAGGEVASGSTVAITAPAGSIYYTTDGSDPDEHSTAYSTPIAITAQITIKAIAKDNYGYSAVASGNYSVAVPKLKVTANAAGSTVTFTDTNSNTYTLNLDRGENEFPIDTKLGNQTTFASCVFSDKSKIMSVDFGGITLNSAASLFENAHALSSISGLVVNGSISKIMRNCYVNYVQISGVATNAQDAFRGMMTAASPYFMELDISGLVFSENGGVNANSMFGGSYFTPPLDLSSLDFSLTDDQSWFLGQTHTATVIVGNLVCVSGSIDIPFASSTINTMRITSPTPPPLSGTHPKDSAKTCADWVALLINARPSVRIEVPSGCKSVYIADSDWAQYASYIDEYND